VDFFVQWRGVLVLSFLIDNAAVEATVTVVMWVNEAKTDSPLVLLEIWVVPVDTPIPLSELISVCVTTSATELLLLLQTLDMFVMIINFFGALLNMKLP
jgi:hypothetical protein